MRVSGCWVRPYVTWGLGKGSEDSLVKARRRQALHEHALFPFSFSRWPRMNWLTSCLQSHDIERTDEHNVQPSVSIESDMSLGSEREVVIRDAELR